MNDDDWTRCNRAQTALDAHVKERGVVHFADAWKDRLKALRDDLDLWEEKMRSPKRRTGASRWSSGTNWTSEMTVPFEGVSDNGSDDALGAALMSFYRTTAELVKYYMDHHPDLRVRELAEVVWKKKHAQPST